MTHQLFTVKGNKMYDITPIIGDINWYSNINQLGQRMEFSIAYNDTKHFPINPCDIGNLMILKNGSNEIFRGVTITESKNGRSPIVYNCFDYAFYLNKSKAIYQFNKASAKQAITIILNDFNVPIGNIVEIPTIISHIYINQEVSEIIKDILNQAEKDQSKKYRMEMRAGKLYIENQESLVIKATFKLASNLSENNAIDAIGDATRTRSIEDMKNSIQLIYDDKIITSLKDEGLIKQYGLLQEIQSIDEKDVAQAKNIVKNLLKELGKIFEENSISLLGDDRVRSGRIIEINEPVTGMKGQYLIEDSVHNVAGGIHKMTLGLGVI